MIRNNMRINKNKLFILGGAVFGLVIVTLLKHFGLVNDPTTKLWMIGSGVVLILIGAAILFYLKNLDKNNK